MKIADLKAFVETKLLSKSDKALEKIGQDDPKPLDQCQPVRFQNIAKRILDVCTPASFTTCPNTKTLLNNIGNIIFFFQAQSFM